MTDNRYANELLDFASKLDAVTNDKGNTTKYAMDIVEGLDNNSTISLLNKIANIKKTDNTSENTKLMAKALKDSILMFFGYTEVKSIYENSLQADENCKTLPELILELNELIGLDNVKSKVNDLISFQRIQMLRKRSGLHSQKSTLHMAFTGNPGTGKTTVARIVGRIYKQLGLLSKGHFIEVSRTDLIAGYQGQTALKVKKVIEQAKGGVLFIDEAYSLTENDHSDSYGRECLTELTKALEDYRDDLVVIVAGYTEPMNKFFDSNPGLKSRFNTFIEFGDYSSEELLSILVCLCKKNDYILSDEVSSKIKKYLNAQIEHKTENFSNGRLMRNIYDDLVMNHAKRVVSLDNPTREALSMIIESDFVDSTDSPEEKINI